MRVLVVTVVHTPLDARIHQRQIRAMTEAGWSVTYAAPWDATSTPRDAAGDGVVAVDLPRAAGRRRLGALRAARRAIGRLGPRHDLVLIHDPELVLAVLGRRGLPPVVWDVHEDLAASLVDRTWLPDALKPLVGALARRVERVAERRLTLLLAEERYAERFARPHVVVRNLPPLPADPAPAGRDRLVYVGRISRGRGVEEMIALGRSLGSAGPRVELVGQVDDDVREMLERAHAEGVLVWHGWRRNEDALGMVEGALAGLSLLADQPNYRVSLPTKVVEYLAHGVPAITTPLPEAVRLVEEADAGMVVPFGDVAAAKRAALELRDDPDRVAEMGRRGRALVRQRLSWDAEQQRFLEALRSVAGMDRGGAS